MIAVTGANGLLGSFVVRELLDRGLPFVALKRKNSDITLLSDVNARINWINADISDPVSLEDSLKDISAVIHTAALVSFNPRDKQRLFNTNVNGSRNIVNVCLTAGVKKLVHISSVAALGRQKNQQSVDETSKWVDSPLNSTYAQSKYLAELEVFRGAEEGLNVTVVNPSVILAPANWDKSSAQLFKYVWKGNKFFIDKDLNYVDVRDVAKATVQLLDTTYAGERFILNAGRLPIGIFFREIAKRFGKPSPSLKLGAKMVKTLAFFENLRANMTGSEPLITPETARLANTHFLYQNEKVVRTLNFRFKSIEETLDWCCEYYKHQPPAKK